MARTKDLKSNVYSPTKPASEAAIRQQIDDAIQEVYDAAAKPADTVNIVGNQTISDVKTFEDSPIVPAPTTDMQASTKKYVDDGLLANKNGDHLGTWQGRTPVESDPGIQAIVNEHTTKFENLAYHIQGVGNGITDDTDALISALNTSDTVWIPKGKTYLIGDVEVSGKKIFGLGALKKKTESNYGIKISGTGSVIDGITFVSEESDGQPNWDIKLMDGAKDVTIKNCRFTSPSYSAIAAADEGELYATRISGVLIYNNFFIGYARPIFLLYADNLTIKGNVIRDTSYDGIRLRYNDGFTLIDGNQFINIGVMSADDGQTKDAIDTFYSGTNLTITNNIVRVTKSAAFDIKGVAPDGTRTQKVIISNNQIYKTQTAAINIYGEGDYDTLGNYAFCDGVVVTNNIIQECNQANSVGLGTTSEAAIYIKGLSKYVNISNNYCVSNYGRGILISNIDIGKSASKSIICSKNICVNNGYNGQSGSSGIHVNGVDGLIIEGNICENDSDLLNPYQAVGIYLASTGSGYSPTKSSFIDKNICRNNLTNQILIDANNNRANNVRSFFGNIQEGTGAINRASWQNERSVFFGSGVPSSGDGNFRTGDRIFNVSPSELGSISSKYIISGWICTLDGQPGTWLEMRTLTGN